MDRLSPDDVVAHAIAALRTLQPDLAITRDGLALRIRRGDSDLIWNLHDVARQAPMTPGWQAEVDDMARQLIEHRPSAAASNALEVRLRPDARVPAELKDGTMSAEPVLDGLWAIYGRVTDRGIAAAPWSELGVPRLSVRTLAAAATIGGGFTYADMLSPVQDGVPLFTNAEFHPNVAAALLMPHQYWTTLLDAMTPRPPTLLAAIPAPSRIFLTPVDAAPMIAALRQLISASLGMEEEVLSQHVYRFDGAGWHAIA